MHANIDGFKKEMEVGVDVIKFNQKNLQTGSRTISLTGDNLMTLVCKNKKKVRLVGLLNFNGNTAANAKCCGQLVNDVAQCDSARLVVW